MYTISDYLDFYKNKTLSEINDIDFLLFSLLSYLPMNNYEGKMDFDEFLEYVNNFKNKIRKNSISEKVFILINKLKESTRYKKLMIYNPVSIKNDITQFTAITIRVNDKTIISYKGTDISYIGWIENFRLLYKFPTNTQDLALKYLYDNTNLLDRNIYLVGHSKGGNLALSSLYLSNNSLFKRIKKVYNFDGPGFRYKEFNSKRFNKIKKKIVNYIPTGSIVGVLLDNENYNIVKSNELAWKEHKPTSWCLFGEFFIDGKLSNSSKKIHESSTINIRNIDYKKMELSFEKLYQTIGKDYNNDFSLNYNDLNVFYKNMKSIDPEVSKYLKTIIDSVLKIHLKK